MIFSEIGDRPLAKCESDFPEDRRQAPRNAEERRNEKWEMETTPPIKMENKKWFSPALRMSTTPTHRTAKHETE